MREKNAFEPLTLSAYEPQLQSCQNCFCGLCVESCPIYRELYNEAVTARGMAQICLGLLSGEVEISELSNEILYACSGCGWCENVCSMNTPDFIQRFGTRRTRVSGTTMAEIMRSIKIVEGGKIPEEIKNALVSITKYGNPYGVSERVKDNWIASLGLKLDHRSTILYLGAMVPYHVNSAKMAEAIIHLLQAGHVDFTVLGSEERDSGAFARAFGDEWLFEETVKLNEEVFRAHDVSQIICISPHDYNAFKHFYVNIGDIEIKHYTQVLWEIIKSGDIIFSTEINKRVTYHDPCYLGRRNCLYEEARRILDSIPGLELIEMKRSREAAICCGGGAAGLFMELKNVNCDKSRADQIKEVSPDIVAVACPNCLQMLDWAIKSRNYAVEIKDIAQLALECI
jgi:Fe-S oxidoreductase